MFLASPNGAALCRTSRKGCSDHAASICPEAPLAKRRLMTRRRALQLTAAASLLGTMAGKSLANAPRVSMYNLYSSQDPDGFSDLARAHAGTEVEIGGFMAPPLKAQADFFILSDTPVDICPFCADEDHWIETIIFVRTRETVPVVASSRMIKVRGTLDLGSQVDSDTGFVSRVRLLQATFEHI